MLSPSSRLLSLVVVTAAGLVPMAAEAQNRLRTEVRIPDIPGYQTLACDLHMHTVFSDGNVWPSVRVDEAWREGLDAISITDHIEYNPHKKEIPVDHNKPYALAFPAAAAVDVILIKGAEITRDLPPGHFNALFLTDNSLLDVKEWRDAVKAAIDQKAFVFRNHPSFSHPERKSVWYDEHTEMVEKGWLHGVEVANGREYYPEAVAWCLEKKLTMLGTSDEHDPIAMSYDLGGGEHRPLTLVFVTERSAAGIRDALFKRRTVVYTDHRLIGEAELLKPLFYASIAVRNPAGASKERSRVYAQIANDSQVTFDLALAQQPAEFEVPETISLPGGRVALFGIRPGRGVAAGTKALTVPYKVTNLLVAPNEGLAVTLTFQVTVAAE